MPSMSGEIGSYRKKADHFGDFHILKPWVNTGGHLKVGLWGGCHTVLYVHRLVASTFYECNECRYVRHLNDNPSDNRVDNLRWGSPIENVRDAIRNGTFRGLKDENIRKLGYNYGKRPIRCSKNGWHKDYDSIVSCAKDLKIGKWVIERYLYEGKNNEFGYSFEYI